MSYRISKRILDVLLASVLILLSWPVAMVVWGVSMVAFAGHPMFRQARIGKGEHPFTLWKFRSMRSGVASDSQRLTPWGAVLRKTHLDEWPQLVHILVGQMSLVGPRPLLPEYLAVYTPAERDRHTVLPGIMGLAQACGGNALPWKHRLRYDAWYAHKQSLVFDCYVLLISVSRARKFATSPLFSERLDRHRIE